MFNRLQYLTTFAMFFVASMVVQAAPPLTTGAHDSPSFLLERTGIWSTVDDSSAIGGSYVSTSDASATLNLAMYANGITIYYMRTASAGDATICVDAVCQLLNMAGSGRGAVEIAGLGDGLKTISISNTSTNEITFDALYVHPHEDVAINNEHEQIVAFSHNGDDVVGVLDNTLTAGEAVIILLLASGLMIQMAMFAMTTARQK